jgi:hypothetical protein
MSPLRGFDDITQFFRGLKPTATLFRRCAAGWALHLARVRAIVSVIHRGHEIELSVSQGRAARNHCESEKIQIAAAVDAAE